MVVVPWAWKWSTSLKYSLSLVSLAQKDCSGRNVVFTAALTEGWRTCPELGLFSCSSWVHTHPFQGAFLFYFIFLSSSPSYVSITLCTGFCMRKAAECLLVSHLCIACMFLKADRRNNVMGKGRHRFEDQAPRGSGDVSQR